MAVSKLLRLGCSAAGRQTGSEQQMAQAAEQLTSGRHLWKPTDPQGPSVEEGTQERLECSGIRALGCKRGHNPDCEDFSELGKSVADITSTQPRRTDVDFCPAEQRGRCVSF